MEVLAPLSSLGFTITIVGDADSSYDFDFVNHRTWHSCRPGEAAVHALEHARLYIGTDTGPTHLAALVSPALLVFRNEACPYQNYIADVVCPVAASRKIPCSYLLGGWGSPSAVQESAISFLRSGVFDRP
jgi:hypothetical protein